MVTIEASRKDALAAEFEKPYFLAIKDFLTEEKKKGSVIYPSGSNIFRAFDETPFADVKVVILGQDPYHGPGQAHGLSFSVPAGIDIPPSLRNIYKELLESGEIAAMPHTGDLTPRAQQGVFLLNAMLTVKAHTAASHQNIGRQQFTDAVIKTLSDMREGLIFLLRWAFAQSKQILIDSTRHHVLTAPHPSPLSAHRGFLGSGHFKKVNEILRAEWKTPIDRTIE